MAKLANTTFNSMTVYGTMIPILGGGFGTSGWPLTTGTGLTWYFPAELQVPGAKFRATIIGGGGTGAASTAVAGNRGAPGASGAVVINIFTVIYNLYTLTYTVGATATASSITYNSLTYTAGAGAAGSGGVASGTAGSVSFTGLIGSTGGGQTTVANMPRPIQGGNTPLGYGIGARDSGVTTGHGGLPPVGYGAGSLGGVTGSTATAQSAAAGGTGLILIEW